MPLEFAHPKWLMALLLLLVLVWGSRYTLVDFPAVQRRISLVLRGTILVLLVFVLAGTHCRTRSSEQGIVFLFDQSRSIGPAETEKGLDYLQAVRDRLPRKKREPLVLPFASTPGVPCPLSVFLERAGDERDKRSWRDGTDPEAALEVALSLVPSGFLPHIVVLSDGRETAGNLLATAAEREVAISTVLLGDSREPEVYLAALELPSQVRRGEPFHLDIHIRSNVRAEGTVTLRRDSTVLVEEKKKLEIGENVFRFKQSVEEPGETEFSASVQTDPDTIQGNNRATRLLSVVGSPRVLVLERDPDSIRYFVSSLREQAIAVQVRTPEDMPETPEDWNRFDAVILSNVPATDWTLDRMDLIRTYLLDSGGGVIMLGGEHSFGLGGYHKTPIEEILPVRCDFEQEKEKPALAMALVIDRSGSMGGQKMELAKDAAKSAIELLSPKDFATIIAFDHESHLVRPMQSLSEKKSILSGIATIEAAGGTNLYPALEEAREQLIPVAAKLKHVILLTDGHSAPGDFEGIVRRMVDHLITVSTIGVGEADNELLEIIAALGKGRHYACEDPREIPQIFAMETVTAGKSALQEIPFVPVLIKPTEVLSEIAPDSFPPLLGFVMTRSKPTASLILATDTGDPLLAWWQYGLGVSVAFTSDVKSRWGAEWLTWPDYAKFWTQVVRHAMRKQGPLGTEFRVRQDGKNVRFFLDLFDRADRFVDQASGLVEFVFPDGSRRVIPLSPSAPGRYEGTWDDFGALVTDRDERQAVPGIGRSIPPGLYRFRTLLKLEDRILVDRTRALAIDYPEEWALRPVDEGFLKTLAESTGGRYRPSPEELLHEDTYRTVERFVPLRNWFLALAAIFLVFDVLFRRIDLTRFLEGRR